MLFWTRSFLCIGVATAMAIARLPPESRAAHLLPDARDAAVLAGKACVARPDLCAAALGQDHVMPAPQPAASGAAVGPPPTHAHPAAIGHRQVALGSRSLT